MYEEDKKIYINIYDKGQDKIVTKELEEMVKVLLAWSVPISFHMEALKAQSIIIRTNLVREMKVYGGYGCIENKEADISSAYFKEALPLENYKELWEGNYEGYLEKLGVAVEETEGSVILFNNKPIDARTHLVCGGSTENSEGVEGNVVQYLRKVLCAHCQGSPYFINHKDIPLQEVEKKLGVKLTRDDVLNAASIDDIIDDVVRDEDGRVIKIKIGGKEFKGKEVMDKLKISSTRFSWRPELIRFFTLGEGDGLGLCQYGSNTMACSGRTAEEILKYYYTGVEIKKIKNPSIHKPLKDRILVIDPGHGGEESDDYTGMQGLREKDVNLSIALYLKEELKNLGATVYLTRETDEMVHLNDRAIMANDIAPDFFISIHQNYFSHPSKSGTEIYYFRGDGRAKALGREIMIALNEDLKTLDKGIKQADFFLLRQVMVSSIHLETAYISNPVEEKMLMEEENRKKAAKAIAKGIVHFYRYL